MRAQFPIILTILFPILLVGCGTPHKSQTEAEELFAADVAFAAMSETQDAAEAFDAYLADDAIQLPHGVEPILGRDEIVRQMADGPHFTLLWTPMTAEVATSGDLGYSWGTYVSESKADDGTTRKRHGKYMNVWRKQADGSWKVILDMGNQSPDPLPSQ